MGLAGWLGCVLLFNSSMAYAPRLAAQAARFATQSLYLTYPMKSLLVGRSVLHSILEPYSVMGWVGVRLRCIALGEGDFSRSFRSGRPGL